VKVTPLDIRKQSFKQGAPWLRSRRSPRVPGDGGGRVRTAGTGKLGAPAEGHGTPGGRGALPLHGGDAAGDAPDGATGRR